MAKVFRLWLPVIVWAGLIFYLSGVPDLKTGLDEDFILRKMAHVLEYFILTFFLRRAFKGSLNMDVPRLFVYPAALAFLYAVSDEFHQLFVPGRNGCIKDVLIDGVGIFGLYIVIRIFTEEKLTSV